MKKVLTKSMVGLMILSMLLGMFGALNVSAEVSGLSVVASANFDDATSAIGSYNGMKLEHTAASSVSGTPIIAENKNPYYGKQVKYTQEVQSSSNYQWMEFKLDSPIGIGDNAAENSYAEFSADMKLENSNTGINFEFGYDGFAFGKHMYRLNMSQTGGVTSTGKDGAKAHTTASATGTITIYHNVRIRVDLKNKAVIGIYIDDDLIDLSETPVECVNTDGKTTIDIFRIFLGRANRVGDLSIDNVSVVTYTSADGASPIANKANLRSRIDEAAKQNPEGEERETLLAAVEVAKNPIATQDQVDKAYENISGTDVPEPEENLSFSVRETFEGMTADEFKNSNKFSVTYYNGDEAIELPRAYDGDKKEWTDIDGADVVFGHNALHLNSKGEPGVDKAEMAGTQNIDVGLGKYGVVLSDESPDCYVEFGIDVASYNFRTLSRNITIGLGNSAARAVNIYLAWGDTIQLTGLSEGTIDLAKSGETEIKNIRLIFHLTDKDGNPTSEITGVYINDELVTKVNYPIQTNKITGFDKIFFGISNIKNTADVEFGVFFDNITISKYYSQNGKNQIHSAGELVSLMRAFTSEAKTYDGENKEIAETAIETAAKVYMNTESTDGEIDEAYKTLYATKKRMALPVGKNFDVVEIKGASAKLEGTDVAKVQIDYVTAKEIQAATPTAIGLLIKKEESISEKVVGIAVKTVSIEGNSNDGVILEYDLSGYTDEEKADMYAKVFVFEDIGNQMLADIAPVTLFGSESAPDFADYRYTSEICSYMTVDKKDNVSTIITTTAEPETDALLMLFDSDYDFKDSTDEAIIQNLVYMNIGKTDSDGRCAFVIGGIPVGEYTYLLGDKTGSVVVSSKEMLENALAEVVDDETEISENYNILGIDEGIYTSCVLNGIKTDVVLGEILTKRNYSVYELQELGEEYVVLLNMIKSFKTAKTADYVKEAFEEYGSKIDNILKYTSLKGKKTDVADKYILDNKDSIVSVEKLEQVIDDAVLKAERSESSSGGGGSSGGRGGRGSFPSASASVAVTKDETDENEYSAIVEEYTKEFSDLEGVEWAKPAISLLVKLGSVNGKTDGIFAPDDYVTREEFVKMLLLTFGYTIEKTDSNFVDVPDDTWYADYVMTAVRNGIVKGVSDEQFGTGELISREDAVVLISRVFENMNISFTEDGEYIAFIDEDYISDYAHKAVEEMTKSGIVNGTSGNRFAPKENATRAEAAKLIYEAYMYMVSKEV